MLSIFAKEPEVPPNLLVVLVVGLCMWIVPPALHLGALGLAVTAILSLAFAFTLARRITAGQAPCRAMPRA